MKPFDWRLLFDKHFVPYIERGANVKRGEINIRCPFCGTADPSYHMGINLASGWYSCWRHKQGHSGKSPVRLLMRLLHISYKAARELAGLGEAYIEPDGFDALAARIMGRTGTIETPAEKTLTLRLDQHFLPITDEPLTRRWHDYLYNRYFDEVEELSLQYDLLADRKSARVIIPYYLEDRLIAWTGRAIGPAAIRYLDLPRDECVVYMKETLYLFDEANEGGKLLVVVEGQIDALKIDFYGAPFGVHAVALATNSINPEQIYMLEELAEKYPQVIVMLDNKSSFGYVDSMRLKQELVTLRTHLIIAETPFGRNDPGELRPNEVREWAKSITSTSTSYRTATRST